MFWIVICRLIGDRRQSKKLFLSIFNPSLSIVECVFDCHLYGVDVQSEHLLEHYLSAYGLHYAKNFLFYVSNKGAEKHVNWRSMISAFVIGFLEGSYTKKPIFLLVSIAKQDGLRLI